MKTNYEILNPWGEAEPIPLRGLNPRVDDLNNKTIGLFAFFKEHGPLILMEIERQLKERFPKARFSHFQYPNDLREVIKDEEYKATFEEWLSGIDIAISGHGDAGSCSLNLAYNTAAIENMGKPAVMTLYKALVSPARRGTSARGVPGLRLVTTNMSDMSGMFSLEGVTEEIIRPEISKVLDDIIAALTEPLTEEEKNPKKKEISKSERIVYKGGLEDVNSFLYRSGWSYGMPVMPPTEEAVKEMLEGTDLPPDHVVAEIPPMFGKATVEKIAINAVMAGCLPTYLPVVIAGVKGMMDPKIMLEGWTCSAGSWIPLSILNGPIRDDLNVHSGSALFSPYYRPNVAIPHALGLLVMNIGGVRPGLEDMSMAGHEARFGVCIAENEEESPWEPFHVNYGFDKEDNTITMFWPTERVTAMGQDAATLLDSMCNIEGFFGFDPGCVFIMTPDCAKILADEGWKKKEVISYIMEYARRPATEINTRWIKGNHHLPEGVILPVYPTHSVRRYLTSDHLLIVVAAGGGIATAYVGGGDHGGPSVTKIDLPKNWEGLVNRFKDIIPTYALY